MAFESLAEKLQAAFKKLTGGGRVSEADVKAAMRTVKLALLEADVNYAVVKDFVAKVSEKAVGAEILQSLSAGQHIIKIVRDELCELMGGDRTKIAVSDNPPTVILMCGLQGTGKTTASAKLGAMLKKEGKKPVLAACDIYRPAAIKQLQIVGEKVNVPVFERGTQDPVKTAKEAVEYAKSNGFDTVIIDTAGRLHIDGDMMDEMVNIRDAVHPNETLLVVDAMTGQDAVTIAKSFNEQIGMDGIIMTKMDGDTRGGAALSVKAVTGKPIKFISAGEKVDADSLEPFYPDRMASRILGMGDVLTLIDKAEKMFDEEQAQKLEEKIRSNKMSLDDFLEQMEAMQKMGDLNDILKMIPGMNSKALSGVNVDEKQLERTKAVIRSMTPKERANPEIINYSRKKRIAAGCGQQIADVNRLLKSFEEMNKMMKQLTGGKMKKNKGMMNALGRKMRF
ncbi:MAG: signal recognition particle protein [Clostridiales bacterium]|nr:signal recognition particle protein [Clostridiales bacterium]